MTIHGAVAENDINNDWKRPHPSNASLLAHVVSHVIPQWVLHHME